MSEQAGVNLIFLVVYTVSDKLVSHAVYRLIRAKDRREAIEIAGKEEHSPEFLDLDSGEWTVGYPHTLVNVDRITPVTEQEAALLERLGIARFAE